jgi:hypothetical protein
MWLRTYFKQDIDRENETYLEYKDSLEPFERDEDIELDSQPTNEGDLGCARLVLPDSG